MDMISIEVQCHAGRKADEYPQRFKFEDRWIEVREIADTWRARAWDPKSPVSDYFRVLDEEGAGWLLKHDLESEKWWLARK